MGERGVDLGSGGTLAPASVADAGSAPAPADMGVGGSRGGAADATPEAGSGGTPVPEPAAPGTGANGAHAPAASAEAGTSPDALLTEQAREREAELREFRGHVAEFLAFIGEVRNVSPNTRRAYAQDLEAFCAWCAREGVRPMVVSHAELRSWLAELGGAGYAATTINRHLSAVRSLYRWMLGRDITSEDAAAAVASPKLARRLPKTMGDADVRRIIGACGDEPAGLRDAAFIELLYATGARISEAAALDVAGIDREAGSVRLFGKGSKERLVPLYARALRSLDRYLSEARPQLVSASAHPALETALFVSSRGRRMSADALRRRFRALVLSAGLDPTLTPHAMRHTFASELLEGGADLRSVQELLGHESLSTTQIYTHLTSERLKSAARLAHPRGI